MRPVLIFRTCGNYSFFVAAIPSIGTAFSHFANDLPGNILCTIKLINWGRKHRGLTELPANDEHPLSKVAPNAGPGQTSRFEQLKKASSARDGVSWLSPSAIGGKIGGKIGGAATADTHGDQVRNGGRAGSALGLKYKPRTKPQARYTKPRAPSTCQVTGCPHPEMCKGRTSRRSCPAALEFKPRKPKTCQVTGCLHPEMCKGRTARLLCPYSVAAMSNGKKAKQATLPFGKK